MLKLESVTMAQVVPGDIVVIEGIARKCTKTEGIGRVTLTFENFPYTHEITAGSQFVIDRVYATIFTFALDKRHRQIVSGRLDVVAQTLDEAGQILVDTYGLDHLDFSLQDAKDASTALINSIL